MSASEGFGGQASARKCRGPILRRDRIAGVIGRDGPSLSPRFTVTNFGLPHSAGQGVRKLCRADSDEDREGIRQGLGAERWDGDKSYPPCGDEAGTLLLIARVSAQSAGTVSGATLLAETRQGTCFCCQGFGAERRDGGRSHPPCGDKEGRCSDCQDFGAERIHCNFQGKESGPKDTKLASALQAWAPKCRRDSSGPRMRTRMSDACSLSHTISEDLAGHASRRTGKGPHNVATALRE